VDVDWTVSVAIFGPVVAVVVPYLAVCWLFQRIGGLR
jgi:hypothetical protein